MKNLLLLSAFVLLCFSCTVSQTITLSSSEAGKAVLEIRLDPVLLKYEKDLQTSMGSDSKKGVSFFQADLIKKNLLARPGISDVTVQKKSDSEFVIGFQFKNLSQLFQSEKTMKVSDIITVKENEKITSFHLHLDKKNFSKIYSVSPLKDSPLADALGPSEEVPVSEKDYIEDLCWAFGNYAKPPVMKEILKKSWVLLTVTTPGPITAVDSGILTSPNTVVFKSSLTALLTLEKPLDFKFSFRMP